MRSQAWRAATTWRSDIVRRTAAGLWTVRAELGPQDEPGVRLSADALSVTSTWYRYRVPWSEVRHVHAARTRDRQNRIIFCVTLENGAFLAHADLVLGGEVEATAQEAQGYVVAAHPEWSHAGSRPPRRSF